jgi:hypothetical protein
LCDLLGAEPLTQIYRLSFLAFRIHGYDRPVAHSVTSDRIRGAFTLKYKLRRHSSNERLFFLCYFTAINFYLVIISEKIHNIVY